MTGLHSEAAKIGGVTLQIVRDWVLVSTPMARMALSSQGAGQPPLLKDEHRAALARTVEDGPTPAIHAARWRIVDLCQWLFEEFRISVSESTMSRELRAMGYPKLSARPRHHAQRDGAIDEFKKITRTLGRNRAGKGRRRARHRNLVRRRGARWPEEQAHQALGEARLSAVRAQGSAHRLDLYFRRDLAQGRQGRGARPAQMRHLCDEPASRRNRQKRRPRRHAVLLLDQAGWHMTDKLDIPANITIVPLPPKCPELNPTENVWQFLRENWLSNRVFKSYDDIVDHCCDAWNNLVEQPWRVMSIGLRDGPIGSDQRGLVLTPAMRRGADALEARYVCDRAHSTGGEPNCQSIAGAPIDEAIGALITAEMTPAAVDLALEIRREIEARHDDADRLRLRAVERAQIDADLAQRRFMLVDPNNRLVADTLESQWNATLRALGHGAGGKRARSAG